MEIGNWIKARLEGDIEYHHIIASPHIEYSLKWGIKRLIKKKMEKLPVFEKFVFSTYYRYFKYRPNHLLQLFINRWFKKEIYISYQPGFGDMLQALPYFKAIKDRYPDYKVIAVQHHPDKCKYKEMSYCKSPAFEVNGELVDYVWECVKNCTFIDDLIYGDCWGDGYLYGHPRVLKENFGHHFNSKSFQRDLEWFFTSKDREVGDAFLDNSGLLKNGFISLHIKTSKEHIFSILELVKSYSNGSNNKIGFLLFGQVPRECEEILREAGHLVFNLSGSYGKQINTRQLIYIASKAKLFIGGRGGFNAIYYLFDIPTINIFDAQGKQELNNQIWCTSLWEENEVGKLYWEDEDSPEVIFNDSILKVLEK